MSILTITDEQIIDLIKQLPSHKQAELCEILLITRWDGLDKFTKDGEEHARMTAWKRGRDWDTMNDEERINFVDEIVHEDRQCSR